MHIRHQSFIDRISKLDKMVSYLTEQRNITLLLQQVEREYFEALIFKSLYHHIYYIYIHILSK
jgi:hypothetical protein